MKTLQTLLVAALLTISASQKAHGQEFLKPVVSATPSFLEPGAVAQSLPSTDTGLLAPSSVNQVQEIPSASNLTYGFGAGHGLEINPTPGVNGYGRYGNVVLPTVSTGGVNINTVDCPFIGGIHDEHDGWVYIPGLGWRYLQEGPGGPYRPILPGPIVHSPVAPIVPRGPVSYPVNGPISGPVGGPIARIR
jgi:hypothetical protein